MLLIAVYTLLELGPFIIIISFIIVLMMMMVQCTMLKASALNSVSKKTINVSVYATYFEYRP